MNWLDWTIIAIVVLSVIGAAAQGFFFELFSLAGVILGYLLAAWNYKRVALWFLPHVKSDWAANAAGFLVIFIAVAILAGVAGRIARWAVKEVGLRWFDRFLGAVFGLVKGALVVMVLVMAMAAFGPASKSLAESQFAPYFLVVGRAASWVAPYELREGLRQGVKAIGTMKTVAPESSSKPSGAAAGK
ncbi:MAG: CvpA family protein [Terriglobia bacterium]|jgi:membrane protein required for colicin V production|nr:CvpA family protein [Terriglobia bacterium]